MNERFHKMIEQAASRAAWKSIVKEATMSDEEVLRTLKSIKPCVVNANARNEAIDRACEWGEAIIKINQIIENHRDGYGFWADPEKAAYEIASVMTT